MRISGLSPILNQNVWGQAQESAFKRSVVILLHGESMRASGFQRDEGVGEAGVEEG